MSDWIKAWWAYHLEKSKTEVHVKIDWFSFFFWLTVAIIIVKESWK